MDKWIIAFIKSIYSPTQYVWQKTDNSVISSGNKPVITSPPPPRSAVTPSIPQAVTPPITTTPSVPPQIPVTAAPKVGEAPSTNVEGEGVQNRSVAAISKPVTSPEAPTQHLPIPFTPTSPNTLVGMTLTAEGKILPGVIIEIKSNGNTIRATKSNQLGQFLFAKPLENGLYQLVTEMEGYKFELYSLNLTGQIVKPLKLQAKT